MGAFKDVPAEDLSYRQLQQECTSLGVSAKGKKEELVARVHQARAAAAPATSGSNAASMRRAAANSGQASTQKPAAAEQPAAAAGKAQANATPAADKSTASRRHSVRVQAHTEPAPAASSQEEAVSAPHSHREDLHKAASLALPDEEEGEEEGASLRSSPKSSARRQSQQDTAHQGKSSLPWKGLLAALTILLVLLIAPQPQHAHDWRSAIAHGGQKAQQWSSHRTSHAQDWVKDLARQSSDTLHSVQARLSRTGADMWHAAREKLEALYKITRNGNEGAPIMKCTQQMDARVLDLILDDSSTWAGIKASLLDVWRGHKEDARKGTGVLLAGPSREACSAAAKAVAASLPIECARCMLLLKGEDMAGGGPDAAGGLQSTLARFLTRCPYGVVVLDGIQHVHPVVLPVLINALSEQGHFEQGGKPVEAWHALYIITLRVPPQILAQGDEEVLRSVTKKNLVKRLTAPRGDMDEPASDKTMAAADAFRRRLEHVAPLRGP
ncbi:hypothetical protein WJX72_000773 [[Myrmecia] bisecta]|uniref:SAP domain-containing protein n=1 Tax=[Myrmecia] bisecta TaxID=41462 RepID=A0AAW1QE38_9CHLO